MAYALALQSDAQLRPRRHTVCSGRQSDSCSVYGEKQEGHYAHVARAAQDSGAAEAPRGKRNALQQESRVSEEEIITRFLKSCDIDEIINVWMEVNGVSENDWYTATRLRTKADYMRY